MKKILVTIIAGPSVDARSGDDAKTAPRIAPLRSTPSQIAAHAATGTTGAVPRQAVIGLALAVLLDTGLQIFWKLAVSDMPDLPGLWPTVRDVLHRPIFWLVGVFMAAQAVNWIAVLDHADLSYAHAITSLSYISVGGLSVLYLGEHLDSAQLLGIALILAGVWCVGKSGHADQAG